VLLLLLACSGAEKPAPASPAPGELLVAGMVACELYDGRSICKTIGREDPYPPADGLPGVALKSLSLHNNFVCGLDVDGVIHCGGFDILGVQDVPAGKWSEVAVGNSHACALDLEGAPRCWGADYDHALQAPAGARLKNLVAGDNRTCAQDRSTGDWLCWGLDTALPERGINIDGPPPGIQLRNPVISGSALSGILPDGSLAYFGYQDDRFGRQNLPEGTGWISVDGGNRNACALHESGRIMCWGGNESGQNDVPDGEWTDVGAGDTFSCGRRKEGGVYCWGCDGGCPVAEPDMP
jgi:hypothetical protein